eukprot:TRINITY_DN4093_c0_g1_i1.p1 TRINITY_DN4093_c0_g1~~TRINITY_DN4093_c0_g1_i1.p1  ORF type:complete len:532 (-),score=118.88 TRINITY_DN4093_c0_g1_i1:1074-2669(-)
MPPPTSLNGTAGPAVAYAVPGFAIDVKNLLHMFAQKQTHSFAAFKGVWKDMQFGVIHSAAPKGFEIEYLQSVYSAFGAYMLMYADLHVRTGIIYGLYCTYQTQLFEPKEGIRCDLTLLKELRSFAEQAQQSPEMNEVYAAFERMWTGNFFIFTAHVRYGVNAGDAVSRDTKYAAYASLPSELMRADTLSGAINTRAVYELEEQYAQTKQAFVAAAHQTLDALNLTHGLDKILLPPNIGRTLVHELVIHERSRLANSENLPRHAFPALTSSIGDELMAPEFNMAEYAERSQHLKRPPATPSTPLRRAPAVVTPRTGSTAFGSDDEDSDGAQDMPSFRRRRRRSQSPGSGRKKRGSAAASPATSALSPGLPVPTLDLLSAPQPIGVAAPAPPVTLRGAIVAEPAEEDNPVSRKRKTPKSATPDQSAKKSKAKKPDDLDQLMASPPLPTPKRGRPPKTPLSPPSVSIASNVAPNSRGKTASSPSGEPAAKRARAKTGAGPADEESASSPADGVTAEILPPPSAKKSAKRTPRKG